MKTNNMLKMIMLPVVLYTVAAFTTIPQQKGNNKNDKGEKSHEQSADKGNGKGNHDQSQKGNGGNDSHGKGNGKDDNHGNNSGREAANGKSHGNDHHNKNSAHNDHGDNRGKGHGKSDMNFKSHGNGNSKLMNGKRDGNINWNLNDFDNRWNPKKNKKVTICHNPSGDSKNGVTISVSEYALQAHKNHGDQVGDCNINYSDRWSDGYVKSRENVFNNYEQTWERMSYSEALLQLAAQKLLGLRTNLDRDRSRLSADEIRRRETLIYELDNNSRVLDDQVGYTRQRLDSDVNIIE